jgi:hypothetical protein
VNIPDDAYVTMRWVRENFVPKEDGAHRLVTTGQAAAELGFSPDTWREWASAGRIAGAFRDESETWRLPLAGCRWTQPRRSFWHRLARELAPLPFLPHPSTEERA